MSNVHRVNCDPATPPRGTDPEVWRLRCAMLYARERFPYDTAEARLLDGVERWLKTTSGNTGVARPGGRLRAHGPHWANALAVVAAAVRCVNNPDVTRLLQPWLGPGGASPVGAPGVSPHAGVDFRPLGG